MTKRRTVVSIKMLAEVEYDRAKFGAVGEAERLAFNFESAICDAAKQVGVTITALTKAHGTAK